jgi:hypothetical protein
MHMPLESIAKLLVSKLTLSCNGSGLLEDLMKNITTWLDHGNKGQIIR